MNGITRRPCLRWAAGLLILVACCELPLGTATAEEPPSQGGPEKPGPAQTMTLALKYVSAPEAARLLKTVFGDKGKGLAFGTFERTNSIIISGSAEQLAEVRALLAKLDTPEADNAPVIQPPKVFPLRSIEPGRALEEALRLVFNRNQTGNFSVDPQRRLVIVSADDSTVRAVASLLSNLEDANSHRPDVDVQVRIVWLVSGAIREDAPAPPDDLKEVLPGLAKLGIERPRLAAQTMVNVTANAEFQAKGVAQLDLPCQFSVTGRLRIDHSADPKAAPELDVALRATRRTQGGSEDICSLQTQIGAPTGHLVVLGVTPTGTTTSVFVIQVVAPAGKR